MRRGAGFALRGLSAVVVASLLTVIPSSPVGAASGDISRFAGNYAFGFSGDGGDATSAQLNGPTGVAVAADGRVFIADRANNRIRVVGTDGVIDTLVAGLLNPVDVAVDDAAGLLYFSEEVGDIVNRLSQVDITGGPAIPVVIAGGAGWGDGGDGGLAATASFRSISGIDVGPDGDVYIADRGNDRIRRIDVATGFIHAFAGTGVGGGDNGDALTEATFSGPKDVAVAADGTVYVADEGIHLIRVVSSGQVAVFAGNYTSGFSGDGAAATAAQLNSPDGVAVAPNGDVYIADTSNNRIRKVDIATGVITTVAGNGGCCGGGDGGPATSATIGNPVRLHVDAIGNMWIASEPEHAIRFVEGAPIADAGGPYAIAEGGNLVLDGSGSVSTPGATYEWDLDDDGTFDVTGVSPTVVAADLVALGLADGPAGPVTITLRITDGVSVATDTATVTVTNVVPTASASAPASVVAGVEFTLNLGATDSSPVDAVAPFSYRIDWDGNGVVDQTVVGPAVHSVTHTYLAAGPVNLSVVAVDKDGGESTPVVVSIVVQPASVTTTTTSTPTPTTVTPTTTPVLPPTGSSTSGQLGVALLLLLAGAVLLVPRLARRVG